MFQCQCLQQEWLEGIIIIITFNLVDAIAYILEVQGMLFLVNNRTLAVSSHLSDVPCNNI